MIDYFLSIKDQILNNVTEIKTVRHWNGQTEGETAELIEYPAVFLSIDQESIEYSPYQGRNIQKAAFTFTARVCDRNMIDNVYDDATEWDIFTLKQSVFSVLQSFLPTGSRTPLNRIAEDPDYSHEQIYTYAQHYSSDYLDCTNEGQTPGSVSTLTLDSKIIITNDTYKTAPKGSIR